MTESFIYFLQTFILPIGGVGVFLASVIEEVIVPIPSAFVLLTAGFLFLSNLSGLQIFLTLFLKIVIPASLGITIGSLFVYGLSYKLGKPFIIKYGKWFSLSWKDIEESEKRFSKGLKDEISIFISRAIPIIPSVVIAAVSGLFRINIRTYIIASFLGLLVRTSFLAIIGWQLGNLYYKYAEIISRYENGTLAVILLFILLWILYRRTRRVMIKNNG